MDKELNTKLADKEFLELYINSFKIIFSNKLKIICQAYTHKILYLTANFLEFYKGEYNIGQKFDKPILTKDFIITENKIISPLTGKKLAIEYDYKNKIEESLIKDSLKTQSNEYTQLSWIKHGGVLISDKTKIDTLYYIKPVNNKFILFIGNEKTEEIREINIFTEIDAAQLVAEVDNFTIFQKSYSIDKVLSLQPINSLSKEDIDYILLYLKTFIAISNYNFAIKFQPISDKPPIENALINPHNGNLIGKFMYLN